MFKSEPNARHLVFVSWTDSKSRGSKRALAEPRFARVIDRQMIRHHQVRVVADFEETVVGEMTSTLEVGDFREQRDRIDDQPVAYNAKLAGIERTGRDQPHPD